MPISPMDGLPASHWHDVKAIIIDALSGWTVSLVSDGEDAGVIQRRIVERLYTDEIVIVDVSARNPNVMFELGMRVAFDKPTVIIKDELTPYPFDVAPNEYVEYPRELRFQKIVEFQKRLASKVAATVKPEHTTYLRSFGSFKVAKINTQEVSVDRLILDRMDRLESLLIKAEARRDPPEPVVYQSSTAQRLRSMNLTRKARAYIVERLEAYGIDEASAHVAALRIVKKHGPNVTPEIVDEWYGSYMNSAEDD